VTAALLSVDQAAALVGLKHVAIRRAIQRGELRAYKLCGRIRIRRADLADWLRAHQVAGGAEAELSQNDHGPAGIRAAGTSEQVADAHHATG
jgi:excisionase family DNA binding protein